MKKIVLAVLIDLFITNLYAITPHINKGQIQELNLAQAMKELELNENELKDINKDFFGILQENNNFPPVMEADYTDEVKIYKQTFKETDEVLYRVISNAKEPEPFGRGGIFQKGYYSNGIGKPNLIFADFYDAEYTTFEQRKTSVQINYNFMPVIKNKRIEGIMLYGIERFRNKRSVVEEEGNDVFFYHKAAVYWNSDFSTANLRNTYSNRADIYIDCSKPLIDEKDTFKYTIQNAFDKNPNTSYVEDTDDDLMYVSFGSKNQLEKIALINGYAQDDQLYIKNNRVKSVGCESINEKNNDIVINHRFELEDFNRIYQVFEVKKKVNYACIPSLFIEEVYKGERYSDTCIAEIDYFFKKYGWLFGGIN